MSDFEDMNVRTNGDHLLVETPFGTARFTLDDRNADENLRTDEEWNDLPLDERWHILTEEVETALDFWRRGEL